jgi:hypothetical protein
MAATLDILPTVAAVTGASLPALPIDGVNLMPALDGSGSAEPRTQLLFYYGGELRGVREGRWKRVFEHRTRSYVGVEPGMDGLPGPYAFPTVPAALYDLEEDIGETTDVSARYPEVVARLDAQAEEARERLGDRLQGRVGSEVRPPGRKSFERPETVAHVAVGASVTMGTTPSSLYSGNGGASLTDGVLGTRDHHDGLWLGFLGEDLDATVDLGRARELRRISLDCLRSQEAWIFFPVWVEIRVSVNGREWQRLGRVDVPGERSEDKASSRFGLEVPEGTGPARYLRVRARNRGLLPDWHPAAGEYAWLFVDEIIVE